MIHAIKITRQKTGLGLKDSRELVEAYLAQNPSLQQAMKQGNDLSGKGSLMLGIIGFILIIVVLCVLFF